MIPEAIPDPVIARLYTHQDTLFTLFPSLVLKEAVPTISPVLLLFTVRDEPRSSPPKRNPEASMCQFGGSLPLRARLHRFP